MTGWYCGAIQAHDLRHRCFFIKKAASDAASHRPAERMRMKTTAMQAEVVAAPEGN